jgi:hypothetical protein
MSFWVSGATLVGTVGSAYLTSKGQKAPQQAAPLSISDTTREALSVSREMLPEAQQVAGEVNRFDQQQAMALMETVLPNFGAISKQYMGLVARDLAELDRGNLPPELAEQIGREVAGANLRTGITGEAGEFNLARNLGIGTLDYQNMIRQRSLATLSAITSLAPRISPMSGGAFLTTPAQALAVGESNREYEQAGYNAQAQARADRYATMGSMFQTGVSALAGGIKGMPERTKTPPPKNSSSLASTWKPTRPQGI